MANTKNKLVSEKICRTALNSRLRQEMKMSQNFFKTGMKLRLRQKMILSSNKHVELEIVCG